MICPFISSSLFETSAKFVLFSLQKDRFLRLKERSNALVYCFLSRSLKNLPLRNLQIF